jgi:hypothetical protein
MIDDFAGKKKKDAINPGAYNSSKLMHITFQLQNKFLEMQTSLMFTNSPLNLPQN